MNGFKERATCTNAENESHTFTDTGVGEIKFISGFDNVYQKEATKHDNAWYSAITIQDRLHEKSRKSPRNPGTLSIQIHEEDHTVA
jgi:hypothetical protein